jgi:hypothetical protein
MKAYSVNAGPLLKEHCQCPDHNSGKQRLSLEHKQQILRIIAQGYLRLTLLLKQTGIAVKTEFEIG